MRVAVLGLGFMGSTHLRAWRSIPGVELAAVAARDEKHLSGDLSDIQGNIGSAGEKLDFSAVRKYRDALDAVRDPQVDIVDICLPTDQHAPVAIAALRAGKHVLVEKPLALDGASADKIIDEAGRSGRMLMAAQVLRFIPEYRTAHEMVKKGQTGAVRSAIFRRRCAAPAWSKWLSDPAQSGGGVFDLLIHDVDFCIHAFGMPEAVSATGYEDLSRGIDSITAQFEYRSIAGVTVTGGWHHPKAYPFSMEFTVVADTGTLEYSSAGRPLSLYSAGGCVELVPAREDVASVFEAELRYFTECVRSGRAPEICPPSESAAAVKLTRLMLDSRALHGERIPCNF
jgi:predicted dehydrogenase